MLNKNRLALHIRIAAALVTIGLTIILLSQVRMQDIAAIFGHISPKYIFAGFVLYIISNIFRSLRFFYLLDRGVGLRDIFPIVCVHNVINDLLPARTGELSYVYLLKKRHGVSLEEAAASLFVARLMDLLAISILLLASAMLVENIPTTISDLFLPIGVASIVIALLLSALIYASEEIIGTISALAARMGLARYAMISKLIGKVIGFIESFQILKQRGLITLSIALSVLIWGAQYSIAYVLLMGFDLKMGMALVILGSTFAIFTSILPIPSMGGFGVYESLWAIAFISIGLTKEVAIASGLAVHIILLIYFSMLGAFGVWRLSIKC